MHEPKRGDNLEFYNICKDDTLEVKENLLLKLENNKNNIDFLLFLVEQNIDIFNLSSLFYTDICYHFNSPIDKDIALKDRFQLYYPNITLCENGCEIKGINLTNFKAKCECKLNNLLNNNLFQNNILYQSKINEIVDIVSKTNIEVVKCYKDLLDPKYLFSSLGAYIILTFLIIQIILTIIYFSISSFLIKKYIFDITEKYLFYLATENNDQNFNKNSFSSKVLLNPPIKIKNKNLMNDNTKRLPQKPKTKIVRNKNQKYEKKRFSIVNKNNKNVEMNYNLINNTRKFNNNKINNILISKDENNLDIKKYLSTDLDDMDYDDAIKKDKRKFCNYFYEKLKINQIILNTFSAVDPLRPRVIKIMLFVLEINLSLFINGLFFNEDYVSEIFHSTKSENFFTFIPRSIDRFFYTTLVGVIIGYVIDCFFYEEKKIKGVFKREKENTIILKYEITQIIQGIQKRNKWFIILSFFIKIILLY